MNPSRFSFLASHRVQLSTALLLAAGMACAVGCESNGSSVSYKDPDESASGSYLHTTTKVVSKTGAKVTTSTNHGTQTDTTTAGTSNTGDTNAFDLPTNPATIAGNTHRPGEKLQPFWISMTAEADRAVWDDQFKNDKAMDVLASRTAPTAPMRKPNGDDGAEGLSHVTFASEGADFDPCVSRDGKFIAFASTQHRPTSDIYIKNVNGRTVTQLTSDPGNDVMPAFSPDGQRIAFCSNRDGNWDIYVMSTSGGQALQLTSEPTHELHPTWSPDGSKIAFCRLGETSGRWEMWVMDVSGPTAAEFIGYGMFPQWCPVAHTGGDNRDRILFQRSRERGDHAFSIWTIDYRPGDASSPTEIASAQGQALINANWSPDGNRVVFATIPNPNDLATPTEKMPQSMLWMCGVDGTQKVLLTSGPFMNLMPTWCNDGRIYFVSDRTGVPNVWSIGTEKAITAATGVRPQSNMDTASRPAKHAPIAAKPQMPAPTPTPAPAHTAAPNTEVTGVPENHPDPSSEE